MRLYRYRTKNMHYSDYTKHLEVDSAWLVYDEARAIFGPPGICKLEALELYQILEGLSPVDLLDLAMCFIFRACISHYVSPHLLRRHSPVTSGDVPEFLKSTKGYKKVSILTPLSMLYK